MPASNVKRRLISGRELIGMRAGVMMGACFMPAMALFSPGTPILVRAIAFLAIAVPPLVWLVIDRVKARRATR